MQAHREAVRSRKRKASHSGGGPPPVSSQTIFNVDGNGGSAKVNSEMMSVLERYCRSDPAVHTCVRIIQRHVVNGGISILRDGEVVEDPPPKWSVIQRDFERLAEVAVFYALVFGVVPVVAEEAPPSALTTKIQAQREGGEIKSGLLPLVPCVEDVLIQAVKSKSGLRTDYRLSLATGNEVENSFVAVYNRPDAAGNPTSVLTALLDSGSSLSAFSELALQAEEFNAKPHLNIQDSRRMNNQNPLEAGNLFFDSESRAIGQSSDNQEENNRAYMVSMQSQIARLYNYVQSRVFPNGNQRPQVEEPQPYQTYTVPKGLEIAPAGSQPTTRSDLIELDRLHTQRVCAAFSIPVSQLMQSSVRSSGITEQEAKSVNSNVAHVATFVAESVLTPAFHLCFKEDPALTLSLNCAVVRNMDDVVKASTAGVPNNVVVPLLMQELSIDKATIEEVRAGIESEQKKQRTTGRGSEEEAVAEPEEPVVRE
eukprot:5228546-Prymnesium_polylepis.3